MLSRCATYVKICRLLGLLSRRIAILKVCCLKGLQSTKFSIYNIYSLPSEGLLFKIKVQEQNEMK